MPLSQLSIVNTDASLSRLAVGLWRLAEWDMSRAELLAWLNACLELGVTTFDHADIYGDYTCEAIFGAALAEQPALRDTMQLVTKCGIKLISPNRPEHTIKHYDTSKEHIIGSVDRSLANLKTAWIDLLLLHRPDPLMKADEVAEAFIALKQSGKVLHFGVSNFSPSQFELLASRLDFPLVTNQIELSVTNMTALHDGTLDLCQRRRIPAMAWSPLGGGHLFGGDDGQAVRLRHTLKRIGESLGGAAIDQVALAWLFRHPAPIIPVLGTSKIERVKSAVEAAGLELSREQWFSIWSASMGTEVP